MFSMYSASFLSGGDDSNSEVKGIAINYAWLLYLSFTTESQKLSCIISSIFMFSRRDVHIHTMTVLVFFEY